MHSPDRTYVSEPLSNGDRVQVTWRNNVQTCSLILKGDKPSDIKLEKGKKQIDRPIVEVQGDKARMSYLNLRKEVLAGNKVFAKNGASIPCTQRAEKTPNKEVNVVVSTQGKIKHFNII